MENPAKQKTGNNPKVALDLRTRKLHLDGSNCMDVIDICHAMCCRGAFNIDITKEEYESGQYEARPFCLLTYNDCNRTESCINRKYRLNSKEDGSCIYLGDDSMCTIHDRSPRACKEFICTGGWTITYDFSQSEQKLEIKLESLEDDMVFAPSPSTEMKNIFYSKDNKKLIFVKKVLNNCGYITTNTDFDLPQIDEGMLLELTGLFDGKRDLKDIYGTFMKDKKIDLPEEAFYEIIRKFYYNDILIFIHKDQLSRDK